MSNEIISAFIGLTAGIIGSLFAPWIHWGIEKNKLRHQERIRLINKVRDYVQKDNYSVSNFRERGIYSQIKPFLDTKIINKIESYSPNSIVVTIGNHRGAGLKNYKNEILDNLNKLEIKWKIL